MENYPLEYVQQLAPLVLVQGLGGRGGDANLTSHPLLEKDPVHVIRKSPPISNEELADGLCRALDARSASKKVWTPQLLSGRSAAEATNVYNIKYVDQEIVLPAQGPSAVVSAARRNRTPGAALRSPLSPLSSVSPLYPNGLFTPLWVQKYVELFPAAVVCFYDLDVSSEVEALAREISELRRLLSEYGAKLVVVLTTSKSTVVNPDVLETVASIRERTGMSSKVDLLFISSQQNSEEKAALVTAVFDSIQPWCRDFFLSLEKAVKKRRNRHDGVSRQLLSPTVSSLNIFHSSSSETKSSKDQSGSASASTTPALDSSGVMGTAQPNASPLSSLGWEVRYSIKTAMLAEFRRDLETAIRNYELAYESLLEFLATIPPTSAAMVSNSASVGETATASVDVWQNARTLLDIIVIKIVKLYLYQEHPIIAYRKFHIHLESIFSLLDNKKLSRGTAAYYNWCYVQFSWLSELAILMPADMASSKASHTVSSSFDENVAKICMNQPGFIVLEALRCLKLRQAAGKSSASELRTVIDNYMNVNPEIEAAFDYNSAAVNLLEKGKHLFERNEERNKRTLAYIDYQLGEELVKSSDCRSAKLHFERALMAIRSSGWNILTLKMLHNLYECAQLLLQQCTDDKEKEQLAKQMLSYLFEMSPLRATKAGDVDFVVDDAVFKSGIPDISVFLSELASEWELFTGKILFGKSSIGTDGAAEIQLELSTVFDSIVWRLLTGTSASDWKKRLSISELRLQFGDVFPPVAITSKPGSTGNSMFQKITLSGTSELHGEAELSFASGESRILQFEVPAKSKGTVDCESVQLVIDSKLGSPIQFDVIVKDDSVTDTFEWYNSTNGLLRKTIIRTESPYSCDVIPRRPKIQLKPDAPAAYYFNSEGLLPLEVTSDDSEPVDVIVTAAVTFNNGVDASINWENSIGAKYEFTNMKNSDKRTGILEIKIPDAASNSDEPGVSSMAVDLHVQMMPNGDFDAAVSENIKLGFDIVVPFVASFSLTPQPNLDGYSSIFLPLEKSSETTTESAQSVNAGREPFLPNSSRKWTVMCNIQSNVLYPVDVKAVYNTSPGNEAVSVNVMEEEIERQFGAQQRELLEYTLITAVKDGRMHKSVETVGKLKIEWKDSQGGSQINEILLNPPKFTLTLAEPRVLFDIAQSSEKPEQFTATYYLENPSLTVLKFSLMLENSRLPAEDASTVSLPIKDSPPLEFRDFILLDGSPVQMLPVMPCTVQAVSFTFLLKPGTVPNSKQWRQVPRLVIRDVLFKVTLAPTMTRKTIKDLRVQDKYQIWIYQ